MNSGAVEHNNLRCAMSWPFCFAECLLDATRFEYHPTAVELFNSDGWSQVRVPPTPLLEIKAIWKYYGATPALRDVSALFHAGEVAALMGHNGAGKSTLVKILAGSTRQDSGEIRMQGKVLPGGVRPAQLAGISVIYQDLSLFPKLSVAENIAGETGGSWAYSFRNAKQVAGETLDRLETKSPLRDRLHHNVEELSLALQQRVAIARALVHESRILILDEPTAALSMRDADNLLEYIRQLASRGVGVLFVSHRLSDVRQVADRYLVLRDGAVTLSVKAGELGPGNSLARAMFGESEANVASQSPNAAKTALGEHREEILIVRNATRGGEFSDVSLTLRAGEITVLTGLTGSGRTEFAESLVGLRRLDSGAFHLLGKPLRPSGPRSAMRKGIIYIPEDRLRSGLFTRRSVGENLLGATEHLRSRLAFSGTDVGAAKRAINSFGIRCEGQNSPLQNLSGGNQQKVLLARWRMAEPRVMVLDEPTAGVDVNAKAEIHERMRQWAAAGAALLVISSETDEVLDLAGHILVFHAGTLALNSPRHEIDREQLMAAMLHGEVPSPKNPRQPEVQA
jgi:ABC-type sugar transport system ATPase subunit